MNEITPTRSAVIELKEEHRATQEGYVFLDEKCLLLASEMMRELERYTTLMADFRALQEKAAQSLEAAVSRHGLEGLECYPQANLDRASVNVTQRMLMGLMLQEAELVLDPTPAPQPANPSPEAEACRAVFAEVIRQGAALAAISGNLERLYAEYRRSVRRARALQNVLLPELEQIVYAIETRLEELEQEEVLWARQKRQGW